MIEIYAFSNICLTVSFQKNTFRNVNFQEEYIALKAKYQHTIFLRFHFSHLCGFTESGYGGGGSACVLKKTERPTSFNVGLYIAG